MNKDISIIGGGIAGLTAAIALNKSGFKASIFEATTNNGVAGAGLALAANAIMAFDRLGIKDEIINKGRLLSAFKILDQEGNLITKTDSTGLSKKYGADNFTIHRHDLHQVLLSKIDPDTLYRDKKIIDFEQKRDAIRLTFNDGSEHLTSFVIVADGIHSLIRQKLIHDSKPRYSGYTCWRAVIETPEIVINESSESWGSKGRFGIVPLADNKIYWFACINAKANDPVFKNYTSKDLLNHFTGFHDPVPAILKATRDEDLIWNDIIDLKPIENYAFENIVLIGDSAHAATPNMGQGACQAIEDAVILADEMAANISINTAFKKFEKRRLKRTHSITNTSWKIGKIAQLEHPVLIALRNFSFRKLPSGIQEKQLEKLYDVDF
ncbi:MAG: FAD-dependent monooxygenase [Balneolaceae bacterium]|nr:FAD-dependent monooxygenase [Balneolaceae bacterium]